jgi:hypothetical protein
VASYTGKYQYGEAQGPCQLSFDKETCIVTPSAGRPLAFDLGDIERAAPAEWELQLTLFTGRVLALRQFGPAFGRMRDELMAAWRDRTVECLLLGDLPEVARFEGSAALELDSPTPAQIRLYETNIAVLPVAGAPVQWRLADVDSLTFDEPSWTVALQSPAGRLAISKLAKKTDEFRAKVGGALDVLRSRAAGVLHQQFPFLDPDRLERLLALMPEGRSAPVAALAAVHPKLPDAVVARGVDSRLKPYFDALRARAVPETLMAGFKFIRENEEPEEAAAADDDSAAPPGEAPPLFFWFFFQLKAAPDIVAWEASTGSGRATYLFRIPDGAAAAPAVAALTRGLALVNFRREPVYLPGDSLEQQARYRRYAIGCRKLPDLRALRAAYIGRAIHSTLEAWTAQLDEALRRRS